MSARHEHAGVGGLGFKKASRRITGAELSNLHNASIEILPAPGVGKSYQVHFARFYRETGRRSGRNPYLKLALNDGAPQNVDDGSSIYEYVASNLLGTSSSDSGSFIHFVQPTHLLFDNGTMRFGSSHASNVVMTGVTGALTVEVFYQIVPYQIPPE